MIIVCEPQCKNFSHEKVNSGFLYGLRLAFPEQKLKFYAHASHLSAIQSILKHDGVAIENIEYCPIEISNQERLLENVFSETLKNATNKIFFLSYNPELLHRIKSLKKKAAFQALKFAFVLHGSFESLGAGDDKPVEALLPIPERIDPLWVKLKNLKASEIPGKAIRVLKKVSNRIIPEKQSTSTYSEKEVLFEEHSDDYRYIALSPHMLPNAARYIDVKKLGVRAVVLPTNFAKPIPQPSNTKVKFAVFGYGNSTMLYNIALKLSKKTIQNDYEIRIIGMDNRGTEEFPKITCSSPGKPLSRSQMEEQVQDIDLFLILYDRSRYRLSCSGSILEALSYSKPILHFDNDCINFFDRPEAPIGISCKSVDDFVEKMVDIIERYPSRKDEFARYRSNIMKLRDQYSVANMKSDIREIFSW